MNTRPITPTEATHPQLWAEALRLKDKRKCRCHGPANISERGEWWPCACMEDADESLVETGFASDYAMREAADAK